MEISDIWEAGSAFRFCPSCSSPRISSEGGRKWICPDCGFEYFHNVAVSASVIIDVGGSLVLLRRTREPRRGFLALPGGFVEPGERAEDGALRECVEELGWAPGRIEFLATFPNIYPYRGVPYATCDLYFCAEATALEIAGFRTDPGEVASLAIIPFDAVPWDEIAFESARLALRRYLLE
jgi:ADP-ribose pyrophosphatase YjhB (NUDIX family)